MPKNGQRDRLPAVGFDVTTLDLQGLGIVTCVAVASDGTRVVCTMSALYTLSSSGLPTLLAGHPTERGFKDGQDREVRFGCPCGIVVNDSGIMIVADSINQVLRKVTRQGAVSIFSGCGERGYADGARNVARFNSPCGIVKDTDGIIYVNDSGNNCVRRVAPDDGVVSTLAGDGYGGKGFADGLGLNARFFNPTGLALDTEGNLIVADSENHCIRRVTTAEGRVTTMAGKHGEGGGFVDGKGAAARFHGPMGIAVDGNNNILVADLHNNRIRLISGAAACVTAVAGSAKPGLVDGKGGFASLCAPRALALDERGRLFVAGNNPSCIRMVETLLAPPRELLAAREKLEKQANLNRQIKLAARVQEEEQADRNAKLLFQELENEKQAAENSKKKGRKKKGKQQHDASSVCSATGAAVVTGHAAGTVGEEAGMMVLDDGTTDAEGGGVGGQFGGPAEIEDAGGGANMQPQPSRTKRGGRGRGARAEGAVAVSVVGESVEGWAAQYATQVLGADTIDLLLAPDASNVPAQGIQGAESMFLTKLHLVNSDVESSAAAAGSRSRGDCTGEGSDAIGVGGGVGTAETIEVFESVETIPDYQARAAEAERKLAAVAESNECSMCMGYKNHVLIPCGHLCVCEECVCRQHHGVEQTMSRVLICGDAYLQGLFLKNTLDAPSREQ